MTYGLNYMGSKNKIAEWILSYLPQEENLYDLFCGGCAITHCAMLKHKYNNYFINDIQGKMPQLFIDAIRGKYKKENRWISREEFFKLKDTDGYISCCWSFGGRGGEYLYGKDKEEYKKAIHYAIYFNDFSLSDNIGLDLHSLSDINRTENKIKQFRKILGDYSKTGKTIKKGSHYTFKEIENFDEIQHIAGLNRIHSLENLIRPNITIGDYEKVNIKENSVIYADIPYKNMGKYVCADFDYDRFYNWCLNQKEIVIISEYDMPNDKFMCIANKKKTSTFHSNNNVKNTIERLFIPRHQIEKYNKKYKETSLFNIV